MVLPTSNGDAADRPGAAATAAAPAGPRAGAATATPVATATAAAPPSPAPAAVTAAALASEPPPALDPPSLCLAPPASTVAPLARPGPPDKVCHRPLQGHVGPQEQQHERACATTPTAAAAAQGDEPVQAAAAPLEASTATAPLLHAAPPPPPAMEAAPPAAPDSYEATHVHAVYEAIAPHFSATRHRPWPLVSRYLAAQQPGAVGFDVGCGNGKYLSARDLDPAATATAAASEEVLMLGCDRSAALVGLARAHAGRTRQVLVADGLSLPFRQGSADFALCIAVVHHLSTRDRRVAAVAELLRCLRRGGTALVFVWALEQASSRRGWDKGSDQDLLVPWVMKGDQGRERKKNRAKEEGENRDTGAADSVAEANDAIAASQDPADADADAGAPDRTFHRYYHLYRKGELEEDVAAAGGVVVDSGYERDNWWAIARRDPS